MTFTINGLTGAELDQQRAVADSAAASDIVKLKIVSERGRSATAVDDTEAHRISAQQSMGARPAHGAPTATEEIRRAKLEAFQTSEAAKIPSLVVEERAAAVAEAE